MTGEGMTPGEAHAGLTVSQAAESCGVASITIRRAISDGRLPGARKEDPGQRTSPWRIPIDDLRHAGWSPASTAAPDGSDEAESDAVQVLTILVSRSLELLEKLDARMERIEADILGMAPTTIEREGQRAVSDVAPAAVAHARGRWRDGG